MNDDAFLAFVINNAPRNELETLEKLVKAVNGGESQNCGDLGWPPPNDALAA